MCFCKRLQQRTTQECLAMTNKMLQSCWTGQDLHHSSAGVPAPRLHHSRQCLYYDCFVNLPRRRFPQVGQYVNMLRLAPQHPGLQTQAADCCSLCCCLLHLLDESGVGEASTGSSWIKSGCSLSQDAAECVLVSSQGGKILISGMHTDVI